MFPTLRRTRAITPTPATPGHPAGPTPWARLYAVPFPLRLAATLWPILVVAVCARVALSPAGAQTVVPIYLHAGAEWNKAEDLYLAIPESDFYRYPPVIAAGFALAADWPCKLVGAAWRLACAALFVRGLVRVRRECLPGWSGARAGWWYSLCVVPSIPSFNNGQFNFVIAAAGLHALAAGHRRRDSEAGAWAALITLVKLYPLSLGLLFGLRSRPRYWLVLAAALAGGLALPYALKPASYVSEQYEEYIQLIRADDRTGAAPARAPRDWSILLRSWGGVVVPARVQLAVGVLSGAAMALAVLAASDRREALLRGWALGGIWMTAFGPATEMNTYSILAATAPYLVLAASGRVARVMAWAGYLLLASAVLRGAFPDDWRWHYLGVQALGALLLIPAVFPASRWASAPGYPPSRLESKPSSQSVVLG